MRSEAARHRIPTSPRHQGLVPRICLHGADSRSVGNSLWLHRWRCLPLTSAGMVVGGMVVGGTKCPRSSAASIRLPCETPAGRFPRAGSTGLLPLSGAVFGLLDRLHGRLRHCRMARVVGGLVLAHARGSGTAPAEHARHQHQNHPDCCCFHDLSSLPEWGASRFGEAVRRQNPFRPVASPHY
jgi:hypothetical protein